MEYTVLDHTEFDRLTNYIDPEVLRSFQKSVSTYALCAVEDGKICGVGILDAKKAAQLYDLTILPEYEEELRPALLHEMVALCDALHCDGIVREVYDAEDPRLWDELLRAEGFTHESTSTLYRFDIRSISEDSPLSRPASSGSIVPLSSASPAERRLFANRLVKRGEYDNFMDPDNSLDYSTIYLQDGEIAGCILVRFLENDDFSIEYAYTKGIRNKTALISMLQFTLGRLREYYLDPDMHPDGYLLSANAMTDSLVNRLLPEADIEDHCAVYVRIAE